MTYRASREKLGSLDCVVVQPDGQRPVSAVGVFCHGFGAGGDDLVGMASDLLQDAALDSPVMLVFPAAPLSLEDQGMPDGRAWWLLSIQRLLSAMEDGRFDQVRQEIPDGIDDARKQLTEVIDSVLRRCELDESNLLLAGFSQGAMLSVETACRGLEKPPAALCLYSGALICEKQWSAAASKLAGAKVLQSHGRMDPILPLQTGSWLRELLSDAGCDVDFIEFNGPHTIPYEAIERTAQLLSELANA